MESCELFIDLSTIFLGNICHKLCVSFNDFLKSKLIVNFLDWKLISQGS